MTTYGKNRKKRSRNKELRQVQKREDEQSALEPDAAEAATLDASGWSVSDWPPIGSALEPDAGHPSEEAQAEPRRGEPLHDRDRIGLASGSSALDEGESPQRGSAYPDPRAHLRGVSGRDSRLPSSSASEGCQPQCGPNSPLGGRARTPGDVAEEAWLRMNAKLYPETWKP